MVWIILGSFLFFLDYVMKKWAEKNLKGKRRQPIGKTGCSLVLVHNKGFAGSKMKDKPKTVTLIHGIMLFLLGLLCVVSGYYRKGNEINAFGSTLILGAGASNLYDRIKKGYVTDYLGLPIAKNLVFNLSDLFIFTGGAILALVSLFQNHN